MFWQKRTASITYLADKSEFQGDLHVDGNLRIDGIVHGNIEVIGDMEVGQTGLVEGPEIRAHNLIIHGVVKTHIHVEGRISISRTGRVEGDVIAKEYDVAPGAVIDGHFSSSLPSEARALPMSPYPEFAARPEAEYAQPEDIKS